MRDQIRRTLKLQERLSSMWRLEAVYEDKNAPVSERDQQIQEAAGVDIDDAGTFLGENGMNSRDLGFYFDTEQQAVEARERISKLPGVQVGQPHKG